MIGGIELLQAGKSQTERLTFFPPAGIGEIHAFEIFAFVAVIFFLISFPLTRLAAYLEKRMHYEEEDVLSTVPLLRTIALVALIVV